MERGNSLTKKSLYLLYFITFLSMTGYGVVLPALPYLAASLDLSSFQMGTLITGWALAQFFSVPFWGMLADRIGKKPVLLIGLGGFGAAFLLLMAANSYLSLLLIRIIGAILSSGMQPAAMALVTNLYDKKNRSDAIAKMGAASGLGFLCGPLAGSLLSPFGMTAPFLLSGLLSLLAIPFAWIFIVEGQHKRTAKQHEVNFLQSIRFLFEKDYKQLFLITLGMAVAASSLFSMLGFLLMERFFATPFETGAAFSIQSGAAVFVQLVLFSFVCRHLTEKATASFGLIIQALGFACIALSFHLSVVFIGCIFIGIGSAFTRPTLISMLARQNTIGQGTVMGLQAAMDSLGRGVGPLLAGLLYSMAHSGPFLMAFVLCICLFFYFSFSKSFTEHRMHSRTITK